MDEMLARQNEGRVTSSVTADRFMNGPHINTLEVRRLEMELSTASDHDTPYMFTLPTTLPELLTWTRLMLQVQDGVLVL